MAQPIRDKQLPRHQIPLAYVPDKQPHTECVQLCGCVAKFAAVVAENVYLPTHMPLHADHSSWIEDRALTVV